MSRLQNLSHIDFEDLCRDLALAETKLRFSAFRTGPDQGVDGRHANAGANVILQCKHYVKSSFSDLKKSVGRELVKLPLLKPSRYLLFTSHSLTKARADELLDLLGEHLRDPDDLWGQEDIEGALRNHPQVEKAHLKLWLSSTAVLERILQSGLEAFTQATKEEIQAELKVYVRNPSFDEALKKLEAQKIIVISGPPGVGKTTLARMLSYSYLNDGWEFYAIRDLDEGFARIDDDKRRLFFFDDFLGRIQLDRQSLLQRESALATFVRRVRQSKNARFILTTRAHIFEEARLLSDHIDDQRFQLAKYLLDVGAYTRKIRAYILFNHLACSAMSTDHISELLNDSWLSRIIDHKNYNPRVIASCSSDCIDEIEAKKYPQYIFTALENPDTIWSKPYRSLDMKCKNLLISLFFSNQFGSSIDELQDNFSDLHRAVSSHYAQPASPSDFEAALRSLESGFVAISGQKVSFVNPSLRDFMKAFLIEQDFLLLLPATARRADWARNLWNHVKEIFSSHPSTVKKFAGAFRIYADHIEAKPTRKRRQNGPYWSYTADDLSISDRAQLLLDWWEATHDDGFLELAISVLNSTELETQAYSDSSSLPTVFWWAQNFIDEDHPCRADLTIAIENRTVAALQMGNSLDDLVGIAREIKEYMLDEKPESVFDALSKITDYEFYQTKEAISDLDSVDNLLEHLEHLEELAKVTGDNIRFAELAINEKIATIEEPERHDYESSVAPQRPKAEEQFSDADLRSLFGNLTT